MASFFLLLSDAQAHAFECQADDFGEEACDEEDEEDGEDEDLEDPRQEEKKRCSEYQNKGRVEEVFRAVFPLMVQRISIREETKEDAALLKKMLQVRAVLEQLLAVRQHSLRLELKAQTWLHSNALYWNLMVSLKCAF